MTPSRRRIGIIGALAAAATLTVTLAAASPASAATVTKGQDVSSFQGSVNWSAQYSAGSRFAYIKATEGTYYTNPDFASQYNGSYSAGLIRGSYHFATPNTTAGSTQADYFVAHGGGWSKDGKTLPGALDIEYNPYGAECYGLSEASMQSWVRSFVNEYHAKTGRWAVIYTTTDWWSDLHRQLLRLLGERPVVGRPLRQCPRHAARRSSDMVVLAERRLRHARRRPGRVERIARPVEGHGM